MSSFMKIIPVGAELFRADRQTDGQTNMTEVIVTFRNFVSKTDMMIQILTLVIMR